MTDENIDLDNDDLSEDADLKDDFNHDAPPPDTDEEFGDAYEAPEGVEVHTPKLVTASEPRDMQETRYKTKGSIQQDASGAAKMMTPKSYNPAIMLVLDNLYYRYSMISDYVTCPQLMLYKWILMMEETDTFFAAITGTAGHAVIEEMHRSKCFDYGWSDLNDMFYTAFDKAINDSSVPPKISAKYSSLKAQLDAVSGEYITMLDGYQKDEENQKFYPTCIEQKFVLEVKDEFDRKYLFTGTIDQAGLHPNGHVGLRDIKFRIMNFKPGKTELKLSMQLSLYAYALRFGNPACKNCLPVYSVAGEVIYGGPCAECRAKINTPKWPGEVAEDVEIIWMRNYGVRQKDEKAKMIDDPDGRQEINPATGRKRKMQIVNPEWLTGYKKGDRIDDAHLRTERSAAFLQIHMADIVRLAGMIRDGRFYRNPGDHCNFWCKFSKQCVTGFESQVKEIDLSRLNEHVATIDPFAGSD